MNTPERKPLIHPLVRLQKLLKGHVKYRDEVRYINRHYLTIELGLKDEDLIKDVLTAAFRLPWREYKLSKKKDFICLYVPQTRPCVKDLFLKKVKKIRIIGPQTEIEFKGVNYLVLTSHLVPYNSEQEKEEALLHAKACLAIKRRANAPVFQFKEELEWRELEKRYEKLIEEKKEND